MNVITKVKIRNLSRSLIKVSVSPESRCPCAPFRGLPPGKCRKGAVRSARTSRTGYPCDFHLAPPLPNEPRSFSLIFFLLSSQLFPLSPVRYSEASYPGICFLFPDEKDG